MPMLDLPPRRVPRNITPTPNSQAQRRHQITAVHLIHLQHVGGIQHNIQQQQRTQKPEKRIRQSPPPTAPRPAGCVAKSSKTSAAHSSRTAAQDPPPALAGSPSASAVRSAVSAKNTTPDHTCRPRKCVARNPPASAAKIAASSVVSSMIPFPQLSRGPAAAPAAVAYFVGPKIAPCVQAKTTPPPPGPVGSPQRIGRQPHDHQLQTLSSPP